MSRDDVEVYHSVEIDVDDDNANPTYRLILDGDPAKVVVVAHPAGMVPTELYAAIAVLAQALQDHVGATDPLATKQGTA